MRTLKSRNVEDNIYGKTYKELEKKYLEATSKYGVKRTKYVSLKKESRFNWDCGAVLGYNAQNEIIFGNAFSEYCGSEKVIMVVVHKSDYLIKMAIEKVTKK